ncbi:MAG: hypothetical protein K6T66_07110 [Peptococcaceae bacterium]|nr:hypothetical protein [Peptococcaceae bacterium]
MKYITPAIIMAAGGFLGLLGALMFWGSRKKGMDKKDKKANIFGSVFLFAVAIFFISGGASIWLSTKKSDSAIENIGQQAHNTTAQEAEAPVKAQEQSQQTQEQVQAQQITRKQEAEKAVKSFTQVQKVFQYILTSCQTEIKDISNGAIDPNSYSDLERLSQQNLDLFRTVQNMDIAKQYNNQKLIMVTAVLYLQGSIDNLKSYIDDKKMSKFTEAQDFLQEAILANKLVSIGVSKQALIDGYNSSQ